MYSLAYIGTTEMAVILFYPGVVLLPLALTIAALISISRRSFAQANARVLWVLAVLIAPFFGSLAYFLIGNKEA